MLVRVWYVLALYACVRLLCGLCIADGNVAQAAHQVTGKVMLYGVSRSQFAARHVQDAFRAAVVSHVNFDGGSLIGPSVVVTQFSEPFVQQVASPCVSDAVLEVEYVVAASSAALAEALVIHLQCVMT